MIEVINSKNFVATKTISAVYSTGKSVDVVTLYGGIELDRCTSYNFTILNKEIYLANKEVIQAEVDAFMAEIRAKIEELGGLQF